MDAYDREEMELQNAYDRGEITLEEYNAGLRDLQRDYRDAAHEAADRAHDDELDLW